MSDAEAAVGDWQTVAGSLSVGAIIHGTGGTVIHANGVAARILGRSTGVLRALGVRAGYWNPLDLHGRRLPRTRHPVMESLADGRARDLVPLGVTRPDGSRAWISLRTSVLDGVDRRVLATFSDISEALALAGERLGPGRSLHAILEAITGSLAEATVLLCERGPDLLVVEGVAHAAPNLVRRLRDQLVGLSFKLPEGAVISSAGALTSTASINWDRLASAIAGHLHSEVDLFRERECVYVELAGAPCRAWLCLFRPIGAPTLDITQALEVRRVADQAAARLVLEESLAREGTLLARLETLDRLERTRAAATGLQFALENCLGILLAGTGVDAAAVWLHPANGGPVTCAATAGFNRYDMRQELRRGPLLSRALQGGSAVTSLRLSQEAVVRRQLLDVEGFTFYHAVPLTVRARVLGAVELFRRSEFEPSPAWTDFVRLAAGGLAATAAAFAWSSAAEDETPRGLPADLTHGQRRVLALALEGYDVDAMARSLHLSPHTIKYHLANLYRTLGVADRVELMARAASQHWL